MSEIVTTTRPATNMCKCSHLLREHGYNPETDRQPCKNIETCGCGNFGRGLHTKEELISAGIME